MGKTKDEDYIVRRTEERLEKLFIKNDDDDDDGEEEEKEELERKVDEGMVDYGLLNEMMPRCILLKIYTMVTTRDCYVKYIEKRLKRYSIGNKEMFNDYARNTDFVVKKALEIRGRRELLAVNCKYRDDVKMMKYAIELNESAIEFGSDHIQDNKKLVMKAVSKSGRTLKFASERLRNDRDIVMTAVSNFGNALRWASPELQDDREIVMNAIENNGRRCKERYRQGYESQAFTIPFAQVLYHASDRLKTDRGLVKRAVMLNHYSQVCIPTSLRDEIMFEIRQECFQKLQESLSPRIWDLLELKGIENVQQLVSEYSIVCQRLLDLSENELEKRILKIIQN